IANKLSENLNRCIAVLNKAGAGANIAHQYVATQPADGTTLLLGSVGPLTISPHLTKLNYDPFVDLAPVSGGVHFPNVLVAHHGVGVKNFEEFMQLAKAQPEKVQFASSGVGSASHLAAEPPNPTATVELAPVAGEGRAPASQGR